MPGVDAHLLQAPFFRANLCFLWAFCGWGGLAENENKAWGIYLTGYMRGDLQDGEIFQEEREAKGARSPPCPLPELLLLQKVSIPSIMVQLRVLGLNPLLELSVPLSSGAEEREAWISSRAVLSHYESWNHFCGL